LFQFLAGSVWHLPERVFFLSFNQQAAKDVFRVEERKLPGLEAADHT
jgi:hypothetical protein